MSEERAYRNSIPRLLLFPVTTEIDDEIEDEIKDEVENKRLTIAGHDLCALAERYGTPLYLYDQATMDGAVAAYRQALAAHYPGPSGITYAGKAFLCTAAAQWTQSHDLLVDCTGAGEIHIAAAAGVPRRHILVHGVNKSSEDLAAAVERAGIIVVDNLSELHRLAKLLADRSIERIPDLWLRVRPGQAVATHAYRQTGQEDSKFGMDGSDILAAVDFCTRTRLPLQGIHFHQGSHFHDPAPIGPALDTVLDLLATVHQQHNWLPDVLCPGGGWGVAYHEDELPHPDIETYVCFIARQLAEGCAARQLPLPRLQVEPGRSLVARAGVALYRVGAVKETANRRWLLLDGGMSDNIRPSLYGARYAALPVMEPRRANTVQTWLAGPYCESGDILIEDLPMPPVKEGELVAIPASGAYHLSMGSNYNGARRPTVVWLRPGEAHLIQRRETVEDLTTRDYVLPT